MRKFIMVAGMIGMVLGLLQIAMVILGLMREPVGSQLPSGSILFLVSGIVVILTRIFKG